MTVRHHHLLPAAAALLAALVPAQLFAQDTAQTDPTRIHYFGNSLTDELKYDQFQELATEAGRPVEWAREMAPGVPIVHHWRQVDKWRAKLIEQDWDVVTLQPFQAFETEYWAAQQIADFLLQHQPAVQLYIYGQWPHRSTADWFRDFSFPKDSSSGWVQSNREKRGEEFWLETVAADAREAGFAAGDERSLKNEYELIVLGLRARVPLEKPVKLIPAGHVMELLGHKMRAGQVPGYETPHDLYSDGVHVTNVGSYLVACTFYATIFGESPVGLPIGDYQADPLKSGDNVQISDELARIIQETVWEVVATHPLTGVTSDEPVQVATPSLPTAVVGEPYYAEVAAAFGQAPYTWSLADGSLPAGIELSENGLLSGTAQDAGETVVTTQVQDSSGETATRKLTLLIEEDVAPEIVTPAELPDRRLGEYFSLDLQAKSGNGAIKWETPGRKNPLPPGLTLNADGTLAGAPGLQGSFTFEIQASDSDSGEPETNTRTFSLAVGPPEAGVLEVRPVSAKIKADGVLDEAVWNLERRLDKVVDGDATGDPPLFDIVWDGSGMIYVAVKIEDDTIETNREDLSQGDSVEIFFDALNNREDTYNIDDRRIVVAPIDEWYSPLIIAPGSFGISGSAKRVEGGYVAEFAFRLRQLGLGWDTIRNPPMVLGFDIAVNDADSPGSRQSQVVWQGTAENAVHPNQFGTIILQRAP